MGAGKCLGRGKDAGVEVETGERVSSPVVGRLSAVQNSGTGVGWPCTAHCFVRRARGVRAPRRTE